MRAFLLDAFVFAEMAVIAASLVWIARSTEVRFIQALLPLIAFGLLLATPIFLSEIKGDGDGLYVIGLIPLALIILLPLATLAFAVGAWCSGRKKLRELHASEKAERT